jgi:hypothetical protein
LHNFKVPDLTLHSTACKFVEIILSALNNSNIKEGVNPKIVSERLRHASIVFTLDTYSYVLPDMQKEATNKLGQVFWVKNTIFSALAFNRHSLKKVTPV